jgi:isocitrate dehydrogenase kinase/phosphatase
VTRYGRVVFYDYDEIEYLADCKFRRIPNPPRVRRNGERRLVSRGSARRLSGGVLHVPPYRRADTRGVHGFHRDLLDASWWQDVQRDIANGRQAEVLSYARGHRFVPAGRRGAA